jgi:hypothetical protein
VPATSRPIKAAARGGADVVKFVVQLACPLADPACCARPGGRARADRPAAAGEADPGCIRQCGRRRSRPSYVHGIPTSRRRYQGRYTASRRPTASLDTATAAPATLGPRNSALQRLRAQTSPLLLLTVVSGRAHVFSASAELQYRLAGVRGLLLAPQHNGGNGDVALGNPRHTIP